MYKFWSSNRLHRPSNSLTVQTGLFCVQNFDLQIGFTQQVTVLPYKEDYLVYKFWSSIRLHRTSNSLTVQTGLFCVQNFDLQIGFTQQVTVSPYEEDYLVYKFWSSNRLHRTSNSLIVRTGLFCVQILSSNRRQWTSNNSPYHPHDEFSIKSQLTHSPE